MKSLCGLLWTVVAFFLVRKLELCESFVVAPNRTRGEEGLQENPITSILLNPLRQKRKAHSSKLSELKCTSKVEGQLSLISGSIQVCRSRSWLPITNLFGFPTRDVLPKSCLDAKFKGLDRDVGDGYYWLNPSGIDDLKNAFVAYCDMTSAGGGWMLSAKITHDFAWICPERKGLSCYDSNVDPLRANLFHPVHARDFVDLRITKDENSGIHLKKSIIRKIFESGLQSVRFTFVNAEQGWTPSDDAYAAFNRERSNSLFIDGDWAEYSSERQDYTWNVIKQERAYFKFSGSTLCWGSNVDTSYRFYEHGLHVGAATSGRKKCHLANDETEIMLKSHYANVDGTGRKATWDRAQFGFLASPVLQVPCKRIAIWVR